MASIVQAGPYLSVNNQLTLSAAPAVGNLMIAWAINSNSAAAVTTPTGWTLLTSGTNTTGGGFMGIYGRDVQAGDGTTYAFTGANRGRIIEFTSAVVLASEPSNYYGFTTTTTNGTSLASASVTPLESSDFAVACFQPLNTGAPSNVWTNGFTQLDTSSNSSAKTEFATLENPAANGALSTTEKSNLSEALMMGLIVIMNGSSGSVAPTADASVSPSTISINGGPVQFSGASSSAPSGDSLTYAWTLTSVPAGSQAALSSTTSQTPTLTPDLRGIYTASLVVTDTTTAKVSSNTSTASVTVIGPVLNVFDGSELIAKPLLQHRNGIWA